LAFLADNGGMLAVRVQPSTVRVPPAVAAPLFRADRSQRALDTFERAPAWPRPQRFPTIQVPNDHRPGPLDGVVLPSMPRRPREFTQIEAVIVVDEYRGVKHGRNGPHEIIEGHIEYINAVDRREVIDTQNVELALNVEDQHDHHGLPYEIPVKPGDRIEVEGEYIPARKANARNKNGRAAVIHFTHAPAGYVILPDGRKYK
jgi:hypothetical protein